MRTFVGKRRRVISYFAYLSVLAAWGASMLGGSMVYNTLDACLFSGNSDCIRVHVENVAILTGIAMVIGVIASQLFALLKPQQKFSDSWHVAIMSFLSFIAGILVVGWAGPAASVLH